MVAKCRGYFKLYRSTISNNKVVLKDTGMRICPELVSSKAYGSNFTFGTDNTYIKFFPKDYGGIINE